LPEFPDKTTLELLRAGSSELLTRVVHENTEALLAAAWGLGWKGTDAEDLVQETFVTFLKAVERFEGRSTLKTYLFGILYNKALEKKRKVVREEAVDPIDEVFEQRFGSLGIWRTLPRGPEDEALANETAGLVEKCVEALPVQQRMAFFLREIEQETTESLCNILGVTVTHLGVILFRARNNVRECVQKKWENR